MPDGNGNGNLSPGSREAAVLLVLKTAFREQTKADFRELGASGLLVSGGQVIEDYLDELRGDRARRAYKGMSTVDPIVGAILFAVDMWLRQTDWRVEPNPEAQARELRARELVLGTKSSSPEQPTDEATPGEGEQAEAEVPPGSGAQPPSPTPPTPVAKISPPPHTAQDRDPSDEPKAPGATTATLEQPPGAPPRPTTPDISTIPPRPLKLADVDRLRDMGPNVPPARFRSRPEVPIDQAAHDKYPAFEDIPPSEDLWPEKTEAELVAEFVQSCVHDMSRSWEEVVSEILTMLIYGFAPFEIVYKKRDGYNPTEPWSHSRYEDGRIGWRKLAIRAQDTITRWDVDDADGAIKGYWQAAPPHLREVYIPMSKSLLFRTRQHKGNPEGYSMLHNAWRPYVLKRRFEEVEGTGIERDLVGIPIAWVPPQLLRPNASAEEQALLSEIKRIVTNVRRNEQEGIVFPLAYDEDGNKLFDFTLLNSGGTRTFDIGAVIQRYNQNIAMTVLADFIMLGHEAIGSKALGVTKVDIFASAMEAWLRAIADVMNTHAIPRLMEVNGIDPALSPNLVFGKLRRADLPELGAFLVQLAQISEAGFLDATTEAYLRALAGIPEKEPGEGARVGKPKDDKEKQDITDLPPEMQAAAVGMQAGAVPPGVAAAQAAPPPQPQPAPFPGQPMPRSVLPPMQSQKGKARPPYKP